MLGNRYVKDYFYSKRTSKLVSVMDVVTVLRKKKTNASTRALAVIECRRYGIGVETIAAIIEAVNECK